LERLGCAAAVAKEPGLRSTLKEAQLIIAMGGDGAMLRAAQTAVEHDKPLLGVNLGRLGFLADLGKQRFESELSSLLSGDCTAEKRMLLSARLTRPKDKALRAIALNDVVAHRSGSARILELSATVDGRHIATHRGDGFIAATATGSTAYAMSCGGPIVDPRLDATVIFDALTDADLTEILRRMIARLNRDLVHRDLTVVLTPEVEAFLIEKTQRERIFGARPLRRALQRHVEDPLSEALLKGQIGPSGRVEIVLEEGVPSVRQWEEAPV